MVIEHPTNDAVQTNDWSGVVICIGILLGYLVLTFTLIFLMKPELTPPGFTGTGAIAMIVILVGAFHAAKWCRSPALFLAFGCAGAMLLRPFYVGDKRVGFSMNSRSDVINAIFKWTIFVLAVGIVSRLLATLRWKLRDRTRGQPPRCKVCGYDLRATPIRCPECGTLARHLNATDAAAPTHFRQDG